MSDESVSALNDEDLVALLDSVRRFAAHSLAPATARPETPPGAEVMPRLVEQLVELGLLNLQEIPAYGLWDGPLDVLQRRFAIEALGELARFSPSFAYQVHLQGLANLLNRLYHQESEPCVVVFDGRLGMGRHALVRELAGAPLSAEHVLQLQDCWGSPRPDAPRLLHALPGWRAAWLLRWLPGHGLRWQRCEQAALVPQGHVRGHGFDELETQLLTGDAPIQPDLDGEPDAARRRIILPLTLHALGLLSIACGAARRSLELAAEYSRTRWQGGRLIGEHHAVQQLLATGNDAVWLTQAALERLCRRPLDLPLLVEAWRARSQLHPLLCQATSHAMQVFGGIGYMRDNGIEKYLRDCNQLRLLAGSPTELTLACAEWERLQ